MKLLEHHLDLFRRMDRHVNAGGEASLAPTENHGQDLSALLQFAQGFLQFIHHLEVDHVERRMREGDARKLAVNVQSTTLGRFS